MGLHELQHLEDELVEGLRSVREKKVWTLSFLFFICYPINVLISECDSLI